MELTIDHQPNARKWEKLNVYPKDHARFKALAALYGMKMSDLFSKTVDALEANAAERASNE